MADDFHKDRQEPLVVEFQVVEFQVVENNYRMVVEMVAGTEVCTNNHHSHRKYYIFRSNLESRCTHNLPNIQKLKLKQFLRGIHMYLIFKFCSNSFKYIYF